MLQGSPSRCNWGILWDSPIIRWDRSICWIIRIGVEGSFRILQGFVGIVRFVESFELWLRDPLGFFGIPEGFLRDSWGILEESSGNWRLETYQTIFTSLWWDSWGFHEDLQLFFNLFFFFLSLLLLLSVPLLLLSSSFIYLFFFCVAIRTSLTEILWWFFMGILCGTNQTRPASKFLLHFDLIIAPHCLYYLWHGRHAVITRQRLI